MQEAPQWRRILPRAAATRRMGTADRSMVVVVDEVFMSELVRLRICPRARDSRTYVPPDGDGSFSFGTPELLTTKGPPNQRTLGNVQYFFVPQYYRGSRERVWSRPTFG